MGSQDHRATSLFDDVVRTNTTPAKHSESSFHFLNRTAGPVWERIRALLDEWWTDHPESARASIRGRIRTDDDHAHFAAFFEMYGYQVLRRVGSEVNEHQVTANGRQPDFHAIVDGQPLVLEMTSTGAPDAAKARGRRVKTFYDQIESLSVPNFYLTISINEVGPGNPSLRMLRTDLLAWIGGLDLDDITHEVQKSDRYLIDDPRPIYSWKDAGWSVDFSVIPRPSSDRGPRTHAIGLYGAGEGSWLNDALPVRKRLAEKAGAYGEFGAPFVVAVMLGGLGSDDVAITNALYGDEALIFPINDPSAGKMTRKPNGCWYKPDGWHHTNVSAVLSVSELWPWTVVKAVPTLWHHPSADFPVGDIAPIFRQAKPNPDTQSIDFAPPDVEPWRYFGLPADWPGPEPRFLH